MKVSVRFCCICAIAVSLWAQDSNGGGSSSDVAPSDNGSFSGRAPIRIGMVGAESVPITFSMNVNGSYDSLLGAFRTDKNGNLTPGAGSYGVDGGFTVSGQKQFRRAVFGISYLGNYSHFVNTSGFNGANQSLSLGYSRRVTKRTEVTFSTSGSSTNRIIGNPLNRQTDGLEFLASPVNELFDTRIHFLQSSMAVGFALNNRWQLVFQGNGGVVRRQARALADSNLYGGTMGANYRMTRRSTIGLNYTLSHFDFGRRFGESDINGLSVSFSRDFGRAWKATGSVTGYNIRTIGVRQIALDPVIAALLGIQQGAEAFDSTTRTPGVGVNIEKRLRRTSFTVSGNRGVQPGNGLLLTTILTAYSASVNYQTSGNKWTFSGSVNRNAMSGVGTDTLGTFSSDGVRASVSRTITREIGFIGSAEYRQFKMDKSSLDRHGNRVTIGLTYAPTALPFGK